MTRNDPQSARPGLRLALPNAIFKMRCQRWLRAHAWLVSASYVLVALALAGLLSALDQRHPVRSLKALETSAAEQLLGAIAAGMIAFTGIVFSISLLVAQFWNTAYSFRLMQWLRQTPLTAHAFGVFSATFVYALGALVQTGRNPDLPLVITVSTALVLLLASVVLFLLLLFGTLRQMNLSYVLALIGDRGREVVDAMYGRPGTSPETAAGRELESAAVTGTVVHHGAPKVVVAVDLRSLVELATTANARIDIDVGVGDSVPDGATIASVAGGSVDERRVRRAFLLGDERTMEQDPKFALRLLADVAIRALSPAVNDPTTAVQALDQIEDLLLRVGQRRLDLGRLTGVYGYTRVTYPAPTWEDMLAIGTDEIRAYGSTSLQVVRRLRLLFERLATTVTDDRRPAVIDRLARLDAAVAKGIAEPDLDDARVPDPQGLGLSRTHAPTVPT